jgi:hypothetical protein
MTNWRRSVRNHLDARSPKNRPERSRVVAVDRQLRSHKDGACLERRIKSAAVFER